MSTFTAAPPALGYFYQARYALFLAISRSDDDHVLSIEKFDDVAFEQGGTVTELLQLKHHVRPGLLTDSSVDLWKTLRIWSVAIKQGTIQPSKVSLVIVTTASAQSDSVAACLRPGKERNCKLALEKLKQVVQASRNRELAPAFDAFRQLQEHEKGALVEAVYVVDCASDIVGVKDDIERYLRFSVRPQHVASMYERLEGWWFGQVVDQLAGISSNPILCGIVRGKIDDLREQFRVDALPIDTFDVDNADVSVDERQFVIQLREIGVGSDRINKAIMDHDRTFAQRSRWLREDLLDDLEINHYERRLIDEWEREVLALKDEDETWQSSEENLLQQFGKRVFHWADRDANFPIRPLVSELHITRGSYHMLADQRPPRVWWHPHFHERCKQYLWNDPESE